MMTRFERWFVKRVLRKEFVQGPEHAKNISAVYALVREVCVEEFFEDNLPTMDAFLRERFEATQYKSTIQIK